ncbi:hypothetical protein QHF89_03075 [Polyangium sorediatum]|uniref:DUF421 domain-containing protein n=1 Tax=Polyangium sorediatum TaxID=889274 RepID=A0ABT6NJG8_9BACT|nr:hypothetical protein [Polyangium sorediatum]
MNLVVRAVCVYMALLVIFRIAGKRALVTVTTFDFLLLLIISECTQQALLGQDSSITGAIILVGTLVSLELGLSWLKCRSTRFERWLDGTPLVIIEDGRILRERLAWLSVDEKDISWRRRTCSTAFCASIRSATRSSSATERSPSSPGRKGAKAQA